MSFEKVLSFLVNFFEAEMINNNACSYRFNSFLLDVRERQLSDGETHVSLTPKAFDVLVYLVTHGGHLVHKEELMQAVWPDSFVDEVNLPRTIHTLRKVLGDDGNGSKFIETVPTKGYRFVAKIKEIEEKRSELPRAHRVGNGGALIVSPVHGDDQHVPTNETIDDKVPAADARARSWPKFPIAAFAGVLVIALAGGFWIFKRSSLGATILNRMTPETTSGEAYQYYKLGKVMVEGHGDDYPKARENFSRAITLDPNYSAAYAARADTEVVAFWGSHSHDDISEAQTDVRKAIDLDPSNSYAHSVLCRILTTYNWDHKEAEKECRKGIDLNPNDQEAQKEFAFLMHSLGRQDEALSAMDKAIEIAPTSFSKSSRGMILYQSGRYDEAISQFEQVEATDHAYDESTRWLIRAHEMKGDYPRALECYIRLTKNRGGTPEDVAAINTAYESEGWPGVLRNMTKSPNLKTLFRAGTYAQLGEKDKAFEALEEMYGWHHIFLVTVAHEPTLEPLRSDPRFDDLLKRIGLK